YPPPDQERQLAAAKHGFGSDEYTVDREAGRQAMEYISKHPFRTVALVPRKLWHLYAKDYDGFSWIDEASSFTHPRALVPLKAAAGLYYLGVMGVFGAALIWARRGRTGGVVPPNGLPLVIIAAFTAVYAVYFGASRYHYIFLPWVGIYAGAFAAQIIKR